MGRWTLLSLVRCFNPRTREGCDRQSGPDQHTDNLVSIHAPARGATQRATLMILRNEVSIHAPARGATRFLVAGCWHGGGFNPRTREGCDTFAGICEQLAKIVSIHAPARGATRSCGRRVTGTSSFNPRTRVGCDLFCVMYMRFVFSFNPRTRVGCDPSPDEVQRYCDVSIHAPAWGATQHRCGRDHADHVSIHAPAWGATRAGDTPRGRGRVSIHAPAWGATVMLMTATPRRRLFQSTHPRGVRRVHMV